jgi:hypothetical protein
VLTALLIMLREGFEAALVVAIKSLPRGLPDSFGRGIGCGGECG